jgi:hypothetical protein
MCRFFWENITHFHQMTYLPVRLVLDCLIDTKDVEPLPLQFAGYDMSIYNTIYRIDSFNTNTTLLQRRFLYATARRYQSTAY